MEEFYKDLIHYLPDIVYQVDDKGKFIYINDSIRKLGYDPSELIGKHFSTIIEAAKEGDVIDRELLLQKKELGEQKVVNERRTGKRITKKLDVHLISSDKKVRIAAQLFATGYFSSPVDGRKFTGTVGIVREPGSDRSGKVLLQIERYYRLISDNSSEMIFILAADGTILSVSESAEKNLGLVPFDLIGENFSDFVHDDDQIILRGAFSGKVGQKGRGRKVEFRILGRDNIWFTCETSITPVEDAKGKGVVCNILNAIDVSSRKAFEVAQARRERIYRTLLKVSPDAIILFDREGDVILSNDRAAEIIGLSREEIIGMHYLSMLPEEEKVKAYAIHDALIATGYVPVQSLDFCRHDGCVIPLECSLSVVNDQKGAVEGYLIIFRDVTVKRKAEMEKQRLEDSLLKIIVNRLSDREIELLKILSSGLVWPEDKKEVGRQMNALPGTLDQFVYRIRKKMELSDMATIVEIVSLRFGWKNEKKESEISG